MVWVQFLSFFPPQNIQRLFDPFYTTLGHKIKAGLQKNQANPDTFKVTVICSSKWDSTRIWFIYFTLWWTLTTFHSTRLDNLRLDSSQCHGETADFTKNSKISMFCPVQSVAWTWEAQVCELGMHRLWGTLPFILTWQRRKLIRVRFISLNSFLLMTNTCLRFQGSFFPSFIPIFNCNLLHIHN